MTKKLEELFGLSDSDDYLETVADTNNSLHEPIAETGGQVAVTQTLSNLEKIESALAEVKDLDNCDGELDEIAALAKEAFNNTMDLSMQVDSRFAPEMIQAASSMLGHAVTATTAKINKKLKTVQLQLQKAELDRKTAAQIAAASGKQGPEVPLGQAQVLDRNELLKMIAQSQDNSAKKDK